MPLTRTTAVFMLLVVTGVWGFAFVAQKAAMATMGPLTFTSARCLLGGLAILPLALWEYRRRGKRLGPRNLTWLMLMSLVFFLGSWLQQAGLAGTTATNGGFLTGLYVLFVPLIAFLALRTLPHPILYLCVPLALVGLYYLNGGGYDGYNYGDALVVFSAVFWALHVLMLGMLARATGLPILVSAISFFIAGALSLTGAALIETPTLSGILAGWPQILYVGVLSTAVAFTLQAVAQQYVPPANAAIILSSESLFAALGGALILGERLPPIGYVGAGLMFAAILTVETVPALLGRRRPVVDRLGADIVN